MKYPEGKTEEQVLAAIERVVNMLAPSFAFGYYDVDDIKQYARLDALLSLKKYKPFNKNGKEQPLENFLYIRIKRRLLNLHRDKLRRPDPPCKKCHAGNFCNDGQACKKYCAWVVRNNSKANIMRPLDIENVNDENGVTHSVSDVVGEVEMTEVLRLIDERLPLELRPAYLQMREGVVIPKAKRLQVEEAVREIVKDVLPCPENADN